MVDLICRAVALVATVAIGVWIFNQDRDELDWRQRLFVVAVILGLALIEGAVPLIGQY